MGGFVPQTDDEVNGKDGRVLNLALRRNDLRGNKGIFLHY
jgi:hypothetical protein